MRWNGWIQQKEKDSHADQRDVAGATSTTREELGSYTEFDKLL